MAASMDALADAAFTNAVRTLRPDLFENERRLHALRVWRGTGAYLPTWYSAIGSALQARIDEYVPVRRHARPLVYPDYNLILGESGANELLANYAALHPEIRRQLVPGCNVYTILFVPGATPVLKPNTLNKRVCLIPDQHYAYISNATPKASCIKVLPCGLYMVKSALQIYMINCEIDRIVELPWYVDSANYDDFGASPVNHYWRLEHPQPTILIIQGKSHEMYFEHMMSRKRGADELHVPLAKMAVCERSRTSVGELILRMRPDLAAAEAACEAVTLGGALPGTYLYALGGTLRRDLLLPYCGVGRRKFNWTLPSFTELLLVKVGENEYIAQRDMLHPLVAEAAAEHGDHLYFKYIAGDKAGHWQFWPVPDDDDVDVYYMGGGRTVAVEYELGAGRPAEQILPCGLAVVREEDRVYLRSITELEEIDNVDEVIYDDYGCEYEQPNADLYDLTQYSPIMSIINIVNKPQRFAAYVRAKKDADADADANAPN